MLISLLTDYEKLQSHFSSLIEFQLFVSSLTQLNYVDCVELNEDDTYSKAMV